MGIAELGGRRLAEPLARPIARGLLAAHIRPNGITTLGLIISAGVAVLFGMGEFRWAGAAILLAGICDILDGAMARLGDYRSEFGAFYDSFIDRLSDMFLLGGLVYYYGRVGESPEFIAALGAIGGCFMVSYARARAEGLGLNGNVGVAERPERIIITALGALIYPPLTLDIAVWILLVITYLTAIYRAIYVWQQWHSHK
jgi:CDP-diacylglycerol--glycerol-3-phosphate 3-phosphatidyltransferase